MKSKSPELKHVELKDVVVVDNEDPKDGGDSGSAKQQERPEFSLVPSTEWEKASVLFNALPKGKGETDLVSVEDVKKKWKTDHEEASQFQIDRIVNMVQQEKNGMMTLNGFALGSLLFSAVLPESCSVKEYIAT
ncbi:hypothetical protein Pelo_4660 [Pelomyxa schiedti]|nr:hypothetical protein Pelo_4660 [Pelomyxa schiedti]